MRLNFKTMDGYIAAHPADIRKLLNSMRQAIRKAAPMAEEAVRYGLPTYRLNGNLVHFGAFKHHIGFYPTPSGIAPFQAELAQFKCSKGAIQFPMNQPLPLSLVARITKHRVAENLSDHAKSRQGTKRRREG
jgi:uncharacterized protein YdhG (YjbR/CyaY superfamily)